MSSQKVDSIEKTTLTIIQVFAVETRSSAWIFTSIRTSSGHQLENELLQGWHARWPIAFGMEFEVPQPSQLGSDQPCDKTIPGQQQEQRGCRLNIKFLDSSAQLVSQNGQKIVPIMQKVIDTVHLIEVQNCALIITQTNQTCQESSTGLPSLIIFQDNSLNTWNKKLAYNYI